MTTIMKNTTTADCLPITIPGLLPKGPPLALLFTFTSILVIILTIA